PLDRSPARDLTPELDRPVGLYTLSDTRAVGGAPTPAWVAGGAEIAFLIADRGATHLCSVARDGGAVRRHSSGPVEGSALSTDARGEQLVILQGSALEPGDLYLSSFPDSGRAMSWKRLTTLHEEFLAPLQLAAPEERSASTPGGGQVHGWLLKPPDFDPSRR